VLATTWSTEMPLFMPTAGDAVHVEAESAPWLPAGCVPSGSLAEMKGFVLSMLLMVSSFVFTGASGSWMGDSFQASPPPIPVGFQKAAVPLEKYMVTRRRFAAAAWARAVRGANVSSHGTDRATPAPLNTCLRDQPRVLIALTGA
jgi:hypothetical protein